MTGKNKIQFEKWYINDFLKVNECAENEGILTEFYILDLSFKIGVYLAYYDSLGILIDLKVDDNYGNPFSWSIIYNYEYEADIFYYTRNEAYKEAFKQANKLINKNK